MAPFNCTYVNALSKELAQAVILHMCCFDMHNLSWLYALCRAWTGSGRQQMPSRHSATRKPGCSRWMVTSLFPAFFNQITPKCAICCLPSMHHSNTDIGREVQSVYIFIYLCDFAWKLCRYVCICTDLGRRHTSDCICIGVVRHAYTYTYVWQAYV